MLHTMARIIHKHRGVFDPINLIGEDTHSVPEARSIHVVSELDITLWVSQVKQSSLHFLCIPDTMAQAARALVRVINAHE